eukprot:CAMPEP_0119562960 /NCGR_PEP_ID=MMETSP1352-20130426/22092_1 /TAXON_ID=265584 /ORGANISM="Stauroneis constricta, Strain CCMP1120" /LENGTH=2119 /DNA_ID=CAMNT_0007611481 /DNA_START=203 /DNA_END=6559 /DNA_ORIENTATION=-
MSVKAIVVFAAGFLTLLANVATTANAQQVYECTRPSTIDGSVSVEVTHTNIQLVKYRFGACTLTIVSTDGDGEYFAPIARSFDNQNWSVSAGPMAGELGIDCTNINGVDFVGCRVTLPPLKDPSTEKYVLTSYNRYINAGRPAGKMAVTARFLERASFGARPEDLEEQTLHTKTKQRVWVQEQMELPMTSHREFFRKHANPRSELPMRSGRVGPHPCAKNSRWRNFAFTSQDSGKSLTMESQGGGAYLLKVDGVPRTLVYSRVQLVKFNNGYATIDESSAIDMSTDTEYEICGTDATFYQESFSFPVQVKLPGQSERQCLQFMHGNPLVDMDRSIIQTSENAYIVELPELDASSSDMVPVDTETYDSQYWESYQDGDEFLLVKDLDESVLDNGANDYNCPRIQLTPHEVPPTVFGRVRINNQNQYFLYDPRLVMMDNTVENPLIDGGGAVSMASDNKIKCSNAPRTFLNEDSCILSTAETACRADEPPVFSVKLTEDFLKTVYELEGRYVYAIENLPLNDESYFDNRGRMQYYQPPPCGKFRNRVSRWLQVSNNKCNGNNYRTVGENTEQVFARLIQLAVESEPESSSLVKDVRLFETQVCDEEDEELFSLGYIKGSDGQSCWQHVHSKYQNVYDLTEFKNIHFGGAKNITKWAESGSAKLIFPNSHHPIGNSRFFSKIVNNERMVPFLGSLGDVVPFADLPRELQTDRIRNEFGSLPINPNGNAVVVCGSPGEVANDPSVGSGFYVEAFDDDRFPANPTPTYMKRSQRSTIWNHIALNGQDQLRQRVAFALSQILVVSPQLIGAVDQTETMLSFYDIFVRHAFGNYRDILKEVSFHSSMGQMLSSVDSRSYQYSADNGQIAHPDENFAREIMQLFSIGLYELNMDGTNKLDENGEPIQTYDNDDIMSFARAWTGLRRQEGRGNYEYESSRVDPMFLDGRRHDMFPKSDLYGGFIGDKYPLCVDLQPKHFLKKGATYRLLGSRSNPELQNDPWAWENDLEILRLGLDASSPLYSELCAADASGKCTYPGIVTLSKNLDYSSHIYSAEYNVDTIRTVRVESSPTLIYYEYIRPDCVEHAFYNDGRRVVSSAFGDGTARDMMCADPRTQVAQENCCEQSVLDSVAVPRSSMNCAYNGERMAFETSESRCEEIGLVACDISYVQPRTAGICGKDTVARSQGLPYSYHWTIGSCSIQVKVNREGEVAIVHNPGADVKGKRNIVAGFDDDTMNFFRVQWKNADFPSPTNGCSGSSGQCRKYGSSCICDTSVKEEPFFTSADDEGAFAQNIMNSLHVGAPDPTSFPRGTYRNRGSCNKRLDGVVAYTIRASSAGCSNFDENTVFRVYDPISRKMQYLKNVKSTVEIGNGDFSFRNPVHFMSFVDPTTRDAYKELDATIDHYFHHPSHAPFLATRMLQRFGFSNPSPRFVTAVATAYKNGNYQGIGSRQYGDMKAMIAAILLDGEAGSLALDSDPTHGQLREPLLKVLAFLRAMSYHHDSPLMWPMLTGLGGRIGEGVYEAPSVFSFFLSDYTPPGGVSDASLYSPEAQVLSSGTITGILDGMFSATKYGVTASPCSRGFGGNKPSGLSRCPSSRDVGDTSKSFGTLQYSSSATSAEEIVDELALLLTASRLGAANKQLIIDQVAPLMDTDKAKAIRVAQQLIVSTPEFHSNNVVRSSGQPRLEEPPAPPKTDTYKAVIYLMFAGGMDSFNMLVPKGQCDGKDMYEDYKDIRGSVALSKSDLLSIETTGQPCAEFGINDKFKIAQELYDAGDAMFFASMGVLDEVVTKSDWRAKTRTSLFAHNVQQKEVHRLDIDKELSDSGVGGRMIDVLKDLGFRTASSDVVGNSLFASGSPRKNHPVTNLPRTSAANFNNYADVDDMDQVLRDLNSVGESDSSLFGDVWSSSMVRGVNDTRTLNVIFNNDQFQTTTTFKSARLSESFESAAQWIKSRSFRGVEREVIYISQGGYDHHAVNPNNNLQTQLTEVNDAIESFSKEMERQGVWDDVVIITGSDFGRTLTPNSGGGTDHGWAGNGFMMGGGIKGKVVRGSYPTDLSADGPHNIGRGRIIPSLPYEAPWQAIAQWMGVTDPSDLDTVLPNRDSFDECLLFTDGQLFEGGSSMPQSCAGV